MLDAVLDVVLEDLLQLQGVVEVGGRCSDGSEVIFDGGIYGIFALSAAVNGCKVSKEVQGKHKARNHGCRWCAIAYRYSGDICEA